MQRYYTMHTQQIMQSCDIRITHHQRPLVLRTIGQHNLIKNTLQTITTTATQDYIHRSIRKSSIQISHTLLIRGRETTNIATGML